MLGIINLIRFNYLCCMIRIYISVLLIGFIFSGYAQEYDQTVKYLFAGHTIQINTPGTKLDYRLESLNLNDYDGIWLGGDVCGEALLNYSTIQYIDSVVNLGNPETHWAMGNHDAREGNWEWYEELTNRHTYYTFPITLKEDVPFTRREFAEHLEANKIETRPLFAGCLPDQPAFRGVPGRVVGELPNSRYLRDNLVFIGIHPGLKEKHLKYISDVILNYIKDKTEK